MTCVSMYINKWSLAYLENTPIKGPQIVISARLTEAAVGGCPISFQRICKRMLGGLPTAMYVGRARCVCTQLFSVWEDAIKMPKMLQGPCHALDHCPSRSWSLARQGVVLTDLQSLLDCQINFLSLSLSLSLWTLSHTLLDCLSQSPVLLSINFSPSNPPLLMWFDSRTIRIQPRQYCLNYPCLGLGGETSFRSDVATH
jgi:hypothetical protein